MKLKDMPEILELLPAHLDIDLQADINGLIIPIENTDEDPFFYPPKMQCAILHWACLNNHIPLIEKLIENRERYGLNINLKDSTNYRNALDYSKNALITQILVEGGLDLSMYVCLHKRMHPRTNEIGMTGLRLLDLLVQLPLTPSAYFSDFIVGPGPFGQSPKPTSTQKNAVCATAYNRYFYEKGKTKFAITLDESDAGQALPLETSLIAEYASMLLDFTNNTTEPELLNLVSTLQTAYNECLFANKPNTLTSLTSTQQTTPTLGFSSSSSRLGLNTIPNVTTTTSSSSGASPQKPKEEHPSQKRRPGF